MPLMYTPLSCSAFHHIPTQYPIGHMSSSPWNSNIHNHSHPSSPILRRASSKEGRDHFGPPPSPHFPGIRAGTGRTASQMEVINRLTAPLTKEDSRRVSNVLNVAVVSGAAQHLKKAVAGFETSPPVAGAHNFVQQPFTALLASTPPHLAPYLNQEDLHELQSWYDHKSGWLRAQFTGLVERFNAMFGKPTTGIVLPPPLQAKLISNMVEGVVRQQMELESVVVKKLQEWASGVATRDPASPKLPAETEFEIPTTRGVFTPENRAILNAWFDAHLDEPYPSREETAILAFQCGLTLHQIQDWFGNKRIRYKRAMQEGRL